MPAHSRPERPRHSSARRLAAVEASEKVRAGGAELAAAQGLAGGDFVVAVAAGARGTATETLLTQKGFGEVYSLLKERTSTCLDVVVNRRANVGGYVEVSSSDYNPTLRMVGSGRAEFTLQVAHRPRARTRPTRAPR